MILEHALKAAAYKVWDELEPAPNPAHKIFSAREEALTSLALRELSRSNCMALSKIEMIDATKESVRGYDFELVLGSPKTKKWIRLFIQSKRLSGNNVGAHYHFLDMLQNSKLKEYARKNSSLPIYAFYNHLLENDLTLPDYYNSASNYDRRALGITLASAHSIDKIENANFRNFHFNEGYRANPYIYSLRNFPFFFRFYSERKNLAIPFHELAYFTIELAELINKLYRRKQRRSTLPLLLLLPPFNEFFGNNGNLIPIIRSSTDNLVNQFLTRAQEQRAQEAYAPKALLIIETGE